jgi:Kef-type K+ transport system membrane component KefB
MSSGVGSLLLRHPIFIFLYMEEIFMDKTLLDIALILIFTKTAGIVSKKFKMPEVLGALLAGVILGPVVFNIVQYDDNIKLLANLGVIMLMFLAGLETNIEEFKKAGFTSLIIAMTGVMIPLILGIVSAYIFFDNTWQNIFVGVILTATSVSITVETLTELGKLNTRAGINILGAAVIDDVLGLVLISVVLAMAQTTGTSSGSLAAISLITTLSKIILFCLVAIVAIVYLPGILNKHSKVVKPGRELVTFSIAFAFIIAFIAQKIGIAAITGAYICGLVLSATSHKVYIQRNVKVISSGFLSLIFFASVGIEANLKGLNLQVLLITLVMFIAAVVGKVVGCAGAARFLKMSKSEAMQIGVGMVSRGEVAIITANIGLQNHIISQEIFLPTLMVVILTTVITPILLKISFSHKAYA